jgi:steroid 5-alpha reductase family enzyme|tara:strand:- start:15460 stop:16224 length:765 start_codon:yes stop_codon:yes gene_type:complete
MIENLIIIFLINLLVVSILFGISLVIKKADIIDIYWGPSFLLSCLTLLLINKNLSFPHLILITIVGIWAIRLGSYLYIRNMGHPEDARYSKMRSKYGNVGLFFINYLIQAILIAIISLPLQSVLSAIELELNIISWLSAIMALAGIIIEALSDKQLKAFKKDTINNGKVMSLGLWNYSRHPNYFGNSLFWWGISIYSLSLTFELIVLVSPIVMTYFLLKVSGVSMLETQIKHTKEGYKEYIDTTSAFIILPKKK